MSDNEEEPMNVEAEEEVVEAVSVCLRGDESPCLFWRRSSDRV